MTTPCVCSATALTCRRAISRPVRKSGPTAATTPTRKDGNSVRMERYDLLRIPRGVSPQRRHSTPRQFSSRPVTAAPSRNGRGSRSRHWEPGERRRRVAPARTRPAPGGSASAALDAADALAVYPPLQDPCSAATTRRRHRPKRSQGTCWWICCSSNRSCMFLVSEVLGHLLAERGLQDRLGRLLEQPVRAGQRQALLLGQPDQLDGGVLLGRRLGLLPRGQIVQCRVVTARCSRPGTTPGGSGRKHR